MAGIGVAVEEHGDGVHLRPPLRELACGFGGLRAFDFGSAERDERDDVERAQARVHAVVFGDRNVRRDGAGKVTRRGSRVVMTGTGEREDGSVMIGIGVHVEERRTGGGRDRAQYLPVATFRDVRDALEHANQRRSRFLRRRAELARKLLR